MSRSRSITLRCAAALAVAVALATPSRPGAAPRAAAGAAARGASPMTAANRTAGVAPLSVFFDAVDAPGPGVDSPFPWRSGVLQPADGDLEALAYGWDFGDAGAGTWTTTGLPRNEATGFVAAHVFEQPGTYTVTLTVVDRDGARHLYQQAIEVRPFSGATYYLAADGDDRNDGRSPGKPFATFARGFAAVNGGPNRRLLLRRGDRFATPGVRITSDGPGLIGAYGTGPRPVLSVSGVDGGILVSAADWRVMDLDVVGPGEKDEGAAVGYTNHVQTRNALVLRVRSTRFRVGIGNGDWKTIYPTPHDGNAWVECEVAGAEVNGAYVGGRRLALLGNDIHDIATSHVLRVWQAHKGVISHNRLWNPGPTRHALKLHSTTVGDGRPETRWVSVTDNLIRGKTWAVAIGAQDRITDERPARLVVERNRFFGEPSVQVDLLVHSSGVTVRNNVFDATGAARSYTAVWVTHMGNLVPVERRVRVLNNTVVRRDPSSELYVVSVDNGVTDVTVRNNLAFAAGARTRVAVDSAGQSQGGSRAGPGLVEDHNVVADAPRFTDLERGDFSLDAASPAVDAGVALPEVRYDFLRRPRPLGKGVDLGAFESH